jgi:uncharacterized membrane protein
VLRRVSACHNARMGPSTSPKQPTVERLVFFSDAAVAIALTLLILPLLDGVPEAAREGMGAFEYLGANLSGLLSFVLSFVIIARFWRSHHHLFSELEQEPPGMFWLGILWLFAIVFLPVATAMTGAMPVDRPQLVVYIGTMTLAVLTQTAMAVLARRHPETWADGAEVTPRAIHSAWAMTILMAASLAVALVWPGLGYWTLLLLLLARPVRVALEWLVARR